MFLKALIRQFDDGLNKRLEELKKGNGNKKIPKKEFSVYEIRQIKKECKEKGEEFIESDYYDFVFKDFRKDANTIVSLCIQIPRDEDGELVFPTLDEQKIFFEGVCNYLIENYGKNMSDFQQENILKYGQDLNDDLRMQQDVLLYGKTLKQCKKDNPIIYAKNMDKLKKLRNDYLSSLTPPTTRINYYVSGSGGMGKNLMCQALARSLFPQIEDESELYFPIGAEGTTFEEYDGQPIIIWNDCRAFELINKLGGRGNVFEVFDTHPTKNPTRQNVKYSSVVLNNVINIVNSVQPYDEFLNGLAGEYKDKYGNLIKDELDQKDQSYRRFPLIIPLHQEDYDILINKGFMDDTREFQQYYEYKHIRGNMQKIKIACHNNQALVKMIEEKTIQPIIEQHNLIVDKFYNTKEIDEKALLKQFEDYGVQIIEENSIEGFEKVDEPKDVFVE